MSITIKVNDAAAQEKLRRAMASLASNRQATLKPIATKVVELIVENADHDTNAYVNAWAMAGNQAGLGPVEVQPLNPASKLQRSADWYLEGVRFWSQRVANYDAINRQDKWAQEARISLAAAQARLAVFNAKNAGRLMEPPAQGAPHSVKSAVATVGGTGEEIQVGDLTFYRLTNMEPHARYVESRTHLLQNIVTPFRQLGLSGGVTKGFVKRLAVASGLAEGIGR